VNIHHVPPERSTRPMRSAGIRVLSAGVAVACAAAVVLAMTDTATAAPPAAPTTAAGDLPPGGVPGVRRLRARTSPLPGPSRQA
jgi:hypothetical protein